MNLKLFGEMMLAWTRAAFGTSGSTPKERAARAVEEVIELAQYEGLNLSDVYRIAYRVYSRPVGELDDELGGSLLCLLAYAAAVERDPESAAHRTFEKIVAAPRVKWQRKLLAKIEAGTSFADMDEVEGLLKQDVEVYR